MKGIVFCEIVEPIGNFGFATGIPAPGLIGSFGEAIGLVHKNPPGTAGAHARFTSKRQDHAGRD